MNSNLESFCYKRRKNILEKTANKSWGSNSITAGCFRIWFADIHLWIQQTKYLQSSYWMTQYSRNNCKPLWRASPFLHTCACLGQICKKSASHFRNYCTPLWRASCHFCAYALAWAEFAKSLPAGTTQASHVWKIGQRTHHSKTCLLPGLAQSFFFFNLLDSWLAPSFYVCCNVPCLYVRHYNMLQFSPRANKSSNFCNLYVKASFSRKIIFWLVLDLFWICPA